MLISILTTLLLLPPTLSCPYPNTTANATQTPTTKTCETAYPSELRLMNSHYPANESAPSRFFMLLRQSEDIFRVATQVQFQSLPKTAYGCQLEMVVPDPNFTNVYGPKPLINVYTVERDVGSGASWNTYEGDDGIPVFGTVNGDPEVLKETRKWGGVVIVNTVECNETLTFQMGMAFPPGALVNYWDFINVNPPATPVQGWRVVHSC